MCEALFSKGMPTFSNHGTKEWLLNFELPLFTPQLFKWLSAASSQDGGIGTYTLPPHTTKRRTTTNLKTKNNQNWQRIKWYGGPTTKELKKKQSSRLAGGAETGSRDGEDVRQGGGWQTGRARQQLEDRAVPHLHADKLEGTTGETEHTTQGSTTGKESLKASVCKNLSWCSPGSMVAIPWAPGKPKLLRIQLASLLTTLNYFLKACLIIVGVDFMTLCTSSFAYTAPKVEDQKLAQDEKEALHHSCSAHQCC